MLDAFTDFKEVEMIAVENREELMVINFRLIFFVKVLENSLDFFICKSEINCSQGLAEFPKSKTAIVISIHGLELFKYFLFRFQLQYFFDFR